MTIEMLWPIISLLKTVRTGYSSVYPTRDVQSNCCVLKSLTVTVSVVMPATQYAFRFIFLFPFQFLKIVFSIKFYTNVTYLESYKVNKTSTFNEDNLLKYPFYSTLFLLL